MNQATTATQLNRLLALAGCSFPQYLQFSRPYIPPGRSDFVDTLDAIAEDQVVLGDRITQMLIDADASIRTGDFPMEFTDMHDLGIEFLVNAAIAYQEQDVDTSEDIVEKLQASPAAKSLAEEALGMAKGHLESLRELVQAETSTPS